MRTRSLLHSCQPRHRRPRSTLHELCRKGESKDLIARLLGDQVKCYTTPCVQHELKKLGKDVAGGGQAAGRRGGGRGQGSRAQGQQAGA